MMIFLDKRGSRWFVHVDELRNLDMINMDHLIHKLQEMKVKLQEKLDKQAAELSQEVK